MEMNKKPLDSQTTESLPNEQFVNRGQPKAEAKKEEDECVICKCDYEDGEQLKRLPCFHKFHSECIKEWFKRQNFCPVCRTEIKL